MINESLTQNIEKLVTEIAQNGYAFMDDFLPSITIQALAAEIDLLHVSSLMQEAGTGRQHKTVNKDLRGDSIFWLDENNASAAQSTYFEHMEVLRQAFNQHLFLGLFALESHLAVYPAGTGYKKHIDRFKAVNDGKPLRQISTILYLNPGWQESDGGHLRLYLNESNAMENLDIVPESGRLMVFLSDTFYHEVLPATRDRKSLTGWFLTR